MMWPGIWNEVKHDIGSDRIKCPFIAGRGEQGVLVFPGHGAELGGKNRFKKESMTRRDATVFNRTQNNRAGVPHEINRADLCVGDAPFFQANSLPTAINKIRLLKGIAKVLKLQSDSVPLQTQQSLILAFANTSLSL